MNKVEVATDARHQSAMALTGTVARRRYVAHVTKPRLHLLLRSAAGDDMEACFTGAWAAQCAFVVEGDEVTVSRFAVLDRAASPARGGGGAVGEEDDATLSTPTACPFSIAPNEHTTVTVGRQQRVVVTTGDVERAGLSPAQAAQRDMRQATARGGGGDAPPAHTEAADPDDLNLFCHAQRYYDVINGQKEEFHKAGQFVERLAASHREVLDAGCGTGLYTFFLAYCGADVTCVDKSATMAEIVAEKQRWFGDGDGDDAASGDGVKFIRADVASEAFALTKVAENGVDARAAFDLILCVDVLSYLPTPQAVHRALLNLTLHATPGAAMLVSVPNYDGWLPRAGATAQHARHYAMSRDTMSVGSCASLGTGVVDVVVRTEVLAKSLAGGAVFRDGTLTVVTEWLGFALHKDDSATVASHDSTSRTVTFVERTVQTVAVPAEYEAVFRSLGWVVAELYADMTGRPFDPLQSQHEERRVYLLQRGTAAHH
jgi:SAM-dependent methyltransferase